MDRFLNICIFSKYVSVFAFLAFVGCGGDKEVVASPAEAKNHPTNMLVFVDKTSSLQIGDSTNLDRFMNKLDELAQTYLTWKGDAAVIYFIQKNLLSASPYFSTEFTEAYQANNNQLRNREAQNAYLQALEKEQLEFLKNAQAAITNSVSDGSERETDLWAAFKKIHDNTTRYSDSSRVVVVYLSDMVESVNKGACGKDYQNISFKNVSEAQAAAQADAETIKKCYSLERLHPNLEVWLLFPQTLTGNKHPYLTDYWQALFQQFGVEADKVKTNM